MSYAWCRLWHDMPVDPKWRTIAKKSGQRVGDVIAVYNFVLVNASANATERGRTNGLCPEDVATALDLSETDITGILTAMQGKVLDGDIVSGWEKRQPKREDGSAERAKAWRERNRTRANATKRSDTDTDTDKDTDKDADKDKEKKVVPVPVKKPKRAAPSKSGWPEGFILTDHRRALAEAYWKKRGVSFDAAVIWEKFESNSKAAGKIWADWDQAWVTWYSNQVDFARNGNRNAVNGHAGIGSPCAKRCQKTPTTVAPCGEPSTKLWRNNKPLCDRHYKEAEESTQREALRQVRA